MTDIEAIVVGAGVIGLAATRAIAKKGSEVLVLERHGHFGAETSSRNSEVIHAGIYYPKGSQKAQLCVQGRKMLWTYCADRAIPCRQTGKLIVASSQAQVSQLESIEQHARQNGVDDICKLNRDEMLKLEPDLEGQAALLSPSTGVVDSHALMLSLLGEAEAYGAILACQSLITNVHRKDRDTFCLDVISQGEETSLTCRNLVLCTGLAGHGFLEKLNLSHLLPPRPNLWAKGNYFKLTGKAPFSRLIYPVPQPGGLGVHLTLDMGGQAKFGPDVEWIESTDPDVELDAHLAVDPGRATQFYDAIRHYWPDLPDNSLEPDYAGIRPKLVGKGEKDGDFCLLCPNDHGHKGLVVALGIESPGLTACLAIADAIAAGLDQK